MTGGCQAHPEHCPPAAGIVLQAHGPPTCHLDCMSSGVVRCADTCVAAPRHAPCPAAPRRCTTCFNNVFHTYGHDRALPQADACRRSVAFTACPHSILEALGPAHGADRMWVAHVPAARFLQLEGDVRDVTDSLQPLPSCMEAAHVLSASPICPTATADRGVLHMCRRTEACTVPSCPTTMHDMFH